MAIKIDIHSIENAQGSGTKQSFVRLIPQLARTAEEIEEYIQQSCTLTRSDIRAVLTSLREVISRDLAERGTFHLPQIGYLSLRLQNNYPKDADITKLKGNYVGVRYIRFRPEASLLHEVQHNARFSRLDGTTMSRQWTAGGLRTDLTAYLRTEHYITCRTMQERYRLTRYTATRWLRQFVDEGILQRQGPRNSPLYVLNS